MNSREYSVGLHHLEVTSLCVLQQLPLGMDVGSDRKVRVFFPPRSRCEHSCRPSTVGHLGGEDLGTPALTSSRAGQAGQKHVSGNSSVVFPHTDGGGDGRAVHGRGADRSASPHRHTHPACRARGGADGQHRGYGGGGPGLGSPGSGCRGSSRLWTIQRIVCLLPRLNPNCLLSWLVGRNHRNKVNRDS